MYKINVCYILSILHFVTLLSTRYSGLDLSMVDATLQKDSPKTQTRPKSWFLCGLARAFIVTYSSNSGIQRPEHLSIFAHLWQFFYLLTTICVIWLTRSFVERKKNRTTGMQIITPDTYIYIYITQSPKWVAMHIHWGREMFNRHNK